MGQIHSATKISSHNATFCSISRQRVPTGEMSWNDPTQTSESASFGTVSLLQPAGPKKIATCPSSA